MRPAQLVRVGAGAGEQIIELGDVTTVGRQPTNTLQIVDRLVSKEHAVISRRPNTEVFVLRDLDSRNGTYCNDVLVESANVLKEGDLVRIGSTCWRFQGGEEEKAVVQKPADEEPAASIHATMQLDLLRDFAPVDLVADERTLRNDYEKLRLAYTLSGDMAGQTNLDLMLDKILQRIFEWLPVDRGIIMLVNEDIDPDPDDLRANLEEMAVRIRPGVGWEEHQTHVTVPRSLLNQSVGQREAVLSTDARMDARFGQAHSVVLQGIRSSMTVPLLGRDEVIGVLHVDSLISTGLFTEKDLAIIGAIARQASISIDNILMQIRIEKETSTRESLSRMLSPNLVDQIVGGELKVVKGGELRQCTVLFADVRGFTNLTERTPPTEMVGLMNAYFELVTEVIFANNGTLDKYIGDAVMALFGAPLKSGEDEWNAVKAAWEMQVAIDVFNETRRAENKDEIGVGIGIATGQLIAGYMGSSQTLSYTVLGRSVNLSARLCGMAQPGAVLVGPRTMEILEGRIESDCLDPIKLKGITDPVSPYHVTKIIG